MTFLFCVLPGPQTAWIHFHLTESLIVKDNYFTAQTAGWCRWTTIHQCLKVANTFICAFISILKDGDLKERRLYIWLDYNRLQMMGVASGQTLDTFMYLYPPLNGDVAVFLTNLAPLASTIK